MSFTSSRKSTILSLCVRRVWSAPHFFVNSNFSSEVPVAITVAPRYFPNWTAAMPTPPVEPWTKSASPLVRFPLLTRETYAVR